MTATLIIPMDITNNSNRNRKEARCCAVDNSFDNVDRAYSRRKLKVDIWSIRYHSDLGKG